MNDDAQKANHNNIWRNKGLLIYLSGNLLSTLGNSIAGLAIMWLLQETTGSTSRAGLTYLASYLPTYLLLPFAGSILDHFSRKRVMQCAQLINAASTALLGYYLLNHGANSYLLAGYFFLSSATNAFYMPASEAIIPNIVEKDLLTQANAMKQSFLSAGTLFGPTLSALMLAKTNYMYSYVFFLQAILYVCSCLSLIAVPAKEEYLSKQKVEKPYQLKNIVEALKYIKLHPVIIQLMFIFSFANFMGAAKNLLMPFYVSERLGGVGDFAAMATAASATGLIVSILITFIKKIDRVGVVLISSCLVMTSSQMFLGLSSYLPLSMFLFAIGLVGGMISGMCSSVIYQREVDDDMRGRVYSFRTMLSSALNPLGTVIAGFAGDVLPAWVVISLFGALASLITMSGYFMKSLRSS